MASGPITLWQIDGETMETEFYNRNWIYEDKAMVFPVVMYGCESWTIKKPEHQRIDAFELCGVGEDF